MSLVILSFTCAYRLTASRYSIHSASRNAEGPLQKFFLESSLRSECSSGKHWMLSSCQGAKVS